VQYLAEARSKREEKKEKLRLCLKRGEARGGNILKGVSPVGKKRKVKSSENRGRKAGGEKRAASSNQKELFEKPW